MNEHRLIEIFLQVIKINALSGNEKSVADFVRSFLTPYGYAVTEDNSRPHTGGNTGNIIIKSGTGGDFLLLSHMDTARTTEKTEAVIADGKITSKGDTVLGVDNRAGIAVLLFLLEKIALEKIQVKDFTVAFTVCEETTLFGSKFLEVPVGINRCFVFDSGYRPGNFIFSSCGAIGFHLTVTGKASHSGISPEKGINALFAAAKAIGRLPLGRIDEETTMNIGILTSGTAVNVVPEKVELDGEVRSFDMLKAEKYFDEAISVFKAETRLIGANMEENHFWDFKPYTIKEDAPVYKDVMAAITKAGLTPTPKISLGGSDANSLNGRGFPAVNLGIGAQNPHSNDEFIFIEDLIKSAEIGLALIKGNA
jgi:tripeptide aminopeptidase